jgi:DNA repair photolyase
MERWRHPMALITKSQLVIRDVDILARLAERNLARAAVSITTLDRRIARVMEPRAATPERRLETVRVLSEARVPTTVMMAPIVPAITDNEIEAVLQACAEAGASAAGYVVLRLPLEIKDLFKEWLAEHFPDRAARVMSLVRSMRNGRDYDPEWGKRQRGEGPYAKLIADRLDRPSVPLDTSQFRRPLEAGGQQDLFAEEQSPLRAVAEPPAKFDHDK